MMMWRQSGLECRTLSGRLGRVIAKKCSLCSRWWEASGGGSVQQRRRLPLRRRQEASSGEENRLRLFTTHVTSVFLYIVVCLTPVFELGTASLFKLRKMSSAVIFLKTVKLLSYKQSHTLCQHRLLHVASVTPLSALSCIMKTSSAEVIVDGGLPVGTWAKSRPTVHHTFPLRWLNTSPLSLWGPGGSIHINTLFQTVF